MSPDLAQCPRGVKSPWVLNRCFMLKIKDKTENTLHSPSSPPPAPLTGLVLVGPRVPRVNSVSMDACVCEEPRALRS